MAGSLSTNDFNFISELVRSEAAISLGPGKEYLVENRLEPLIKSLDLKSIGDLVECLRKQGNSELRKKVVESMTTHETSFFRDIEPFDMMKKFVIPQIVQNQSKAKELSIWCGAASSGQEPYTFCILLREHFPELQSWKVKFYATDISRAILLKAQSGLYTSVEVNRGLSPQLLNKYFIKEGNDYRIQAEIRNSIEFSEMNLLQPFTRFSSLDLVLLRNVLIYFDLEAKCQILTRIHQVLKPLGFLFLGTAETTLNLHQKFERVAFEKTSCYQKK